MRPRVAALLAWSIFGLSLACSTVSAVALLWLRDVPGSASRLQLDSMSLLAYPLVGALIAVRRPTNPIGWIFCAIGLTSQLYPAVEHAWMAGFAASGQTPEPPPAISLTFDLWITIAFYFPLLFLLFPTGRPLSQRWRPLVWLTVVCTIGMYFIAGGGTTIGAAVISYSSPVKIVFGPAVGDALKPTGGVLLLPVVALWAVALASLVLRLRRARGEAYQQLKWIAYGCALFVLIFSVETMAFEFTPWPRAIDPAAYNAADVLLGLPMAPAFLILPITVGIAVLRYRLYEIDLLINRTLVYAALTAGLGLTYWGSVVLLQQVLKPLTQGSELAIVASTLAVAALFQPARRRIQSIVDRRFYRRKYDAQLTLQQFSARLRQEIELDSLSAELLGVVRESLQPVRASLWLRPSTESE